MGQIFSAWLSATDPTYVRPFCPHGGYAIRRGGRTVSCRNTSRCPSSMFSVGKPPYEECKCGPGLKSINVRPYCVQNTPISGTPQIPEANQVVQPPIPSRPAVIQVPGQAPQLVTSLSFKNEEKNKCLSTLKDGSGAYLRNCSGSDYQKWSNNNGALINKKYQKCLNADSNLVACDSTQANQKWSRVGQTWMHDGRCLSTKGNYPKLRNCSGSSYQNWL